MLLKLYDLEHTLIGGLRNCKEAKVESVLSTGDKTLSFLWHKRNRQKIPHEYYIRTNTDEYVVKENSNGSNGYRNITANLNLEDLEGRAWMEYTIEERTAQEAADYALTDTGWTCVSTVPDERLRNISMKKTTSLKLIEKILEAYTCEVEYDTLNKVVYLKERVGENKGSYFIKGLNLKETKESGDTYDYATRIIPIGADGIEISDVNDGKNYLENYQYSNKVKTVIWEDPNYTDKQALKEDAEYRLNDISKPKRSYSVSVIDFARMKPEYSILSYSVGDTVMLIDNEEGINEKQRITKTVEYLNNPEKNTCEVANTVLSFEEMQKKLFAAAECVENITTDNGTVNGAKVDAIDVTQIIGLERYIAEDIDDLKVNTLYVRSEFGASNAAIGELTATSANITHMSIATREDSPLSYIAELHADVTYGNYAKYETVESENISAIEERVNNFVASNVTTEYLQANYAKINFENVDTANIKQGFIENLMVSQGIIADRVSAGEVVATNVLTGIKIDAGDIVVGKLDAGNIEVVNLNAANITVGTINGTQITPGAIDMTKLGSDVSSWISGTDSNVAQALKDAGIANTAANEALDAAENAQNTANSGVSIANEKNTAYYQTSQPTGGAYKTNDIWYDTDDGYRMYFYNGNTWAATQFGQSAILASAVTAEKIAAGAVTTEKIGALAVTAEKIAANAVVAEKIAASAVTTGTIKAGAITAEKVAAGAITAEKIAAETITGDKLVAGTITASKIDITDLVATGMIGTNKLTAANIAAGAITATQIASGAVTASKIASGTITATQIAAGTITADKINVTDLFAQDITASGIIKSSNYVSGSTGMKLTLSTGEWDSKYLKISSTGTIKATGGTIGGFSIGSKYLANGTTAIAGNSNSVYIGTDGISCGTAFKVTSAGIVDAEGVFRTTKTAYENVTYSCTMSGYGIQISATGSTSGLVPYEADIKPDHIYVKSVGTSSLCGGTRIEAGTISFYNVDTEICEIGVNSTTFYIETFGTGGVKIGQNLSVGGYENSTYTLSTASFICGSWVRTVGTSGWYNETYGGGWYMQDTTYIRSISGKNVLIQGHIYVGSTSYYISSAGSACFSSIGIGAAPSSSYVINAAGNIYCGGAVANGMIRPNTTSSSNSTGFYLGHSSYKWRTVYAYNGTINTSDRNEKHNISYEFSEAVKNIYYDLKAVSYVMNGGSRTHFGIIAQDAEETIYKYGYTIDDLAFLCRDHQCVMDGDNTVYLYNDDGTPKYTYGVRYTELIPLTLWQTQEHEKMLNKHELQIQELQQIICMLQHQINTLTNTTEAVG